MRWRALAEKKMQELDRRIEEARRMRSLLDVVARCECPTFEDCTRALDGEAGAALDLKRT